MEPKDTTQADSVPASPDVPGGSGVTRSQFLQRAAVAGAGGMLGGALLSACGSSGSDSSSSASTAAQTTDSNGVVGGGKPVRGGEIKLAMGGAGLSETFDPATVTAPIDTLRLYCVFDPLVRPSGDYKTSPGLAMDWQPNGDSTVWEVTLREGVTWHDGKPFTADDVLYTWGLMKDPKHFGHAAVANIKLDQIKKLSPTKIQVPLKSPDGRLQDSFVLHNAAMVVQNGTKHYKKPIGTGPFVLESFNPGQRAVFKRNPKYWDNNRPYADSFQVISVDDDAARVNGLLGGQFDVIGFVPFAQAASLKSNPAVKTVVGASGPNQLIYFRVDKPPFNDPRVMQAMKLIADRQALVNVAFSGYGQVLNDLPGKGLPNYASDIPQRAHDIEQAKSLLKQAGQSDLRVTLETSPIFAGCVEAATLYAEQAKAAGVTIQVHRNDPNTYFSPAQGYLKQTIAQDSWPVGSLTSIYKQLLLSDSPANETHYTNARFDTMVQNAIGATDAAQQKELWADVQRTQWENGGNLFWAARRTVDGTNAKIGGIYPGWFFGLGNFNVWQWWKS